MDAKQKDEILRLSSLIATARVRRYAVHRNYSKTSAETREGTTLRVAKAQEELSTYLDGLLEQKK